jgi:hypothetical protein
MLPNHQGPPPVKRPTPPFRSFGRRPWRALLGLTLTVLLAHLWLTYEVAQRMEDLAPEPGIERMQAAYVSEVKLSAPPVAVASVQPADAPPISSPTAKKRKKAPPPLKAASAPEETASAPPLEVAASDASVLLAQAEEEALKEPEPPPSTPLAASAPDVPSAVAEAPSSPRRPGPTFIWPKATRVNYKLEGSYRGAFYGTAYVEWVRQDNRYQVHMEASVPMLGSSRMTSEGLITPKGLSPQRFESVNRMLFKSKVNTVRFEEQEVVLADGVRQARMPEMQDPVSQLIHLAYRFMMNPELLRAGNTIEMPIAWSKRTEVLAYDVVKEETLVTTMGDVPTLHVKPRRVIKDKDNLSGEIWFAPGLQYLPVRIFTRWSDEIHLDMRMDGAPQQTPGDALSSEATERKGSPDEKASGKGEVKGEVKATPNPDQPPP